MLNEELIQKVIAEAKKQGFEIPVDSKDQVIKFAKCVASKLLFKSLPEAVASCLEKMMK